LVFVTACDKPPETHALTAVMSMQAMASAAGEIVSPRAEIARSSSQYITLNSGLQTIYNYCSLTTTVAMRMVRKSVYSADENTGRKRLGEEVEKWP
jgi:hypothetical protein